MNSRVVTAILLFACAAFAVERVQADATLGNVRRIYVEQLGGGQTSDQMRDMIIAALQNSGLFVITESPERADATLRGSSDDKIYSENHSTSESIGLHTNTSDHSSTRNFESGVSSGKSLGAGLTDNETSHIEERHHEASASLRLVDNQGDVIWSSTQESGGGKFHGAMADVADRIARQLAADTRKARAAMEKERKDLAQKTVPDSPPSPHAQ